MISIIIPLFNKEAYITDTINSVLCQSCNDFELIIVNDGSTDNSLEIVNRIQSDKIHIYTKENGGPASARNYGVREANGDWIMILDADDSLEPDALKVFHHLINKEPVCNGRIRRSHAKGDG